MSERLASAGLEGTLIMSEGGIGTEVHMRYLAAACLAMIVLAPALRPASAEEEWVPWKKEPPATNQPAEPAKTPAAPAPAEPEAKPEAAAPAALTLAETEAALQAGDLDKAIGGAKELLKQPPDDATKTAALRVMAEALRKKGEWRLATVAYLKLRNCYEKTSPEYIRHDAIAEILRLAPKGVYAPAARKPGPDAKADDRTLADDEVLKNALTCVAEQRAGEFKRRAAAQNRPRTPGEVVAALAEAQQGVLPIRALSADVADQIERQFAREAGARLQAAAETTIAQARMRLEKYRPKMVKPWSFSSADKNDIKQMNAALTELAAVEAQFQSLLGKTPGKTPVGPTAGPKPEQGDETAALIRESEGRAAQYSQFASEFIVPAYSTSVF